MPLITDGNIGRGFLRDRKILTLLLSRGDKSTTGREIPKIAYEYAKQMSNLLGKPLDEVLDSKPVRKYIERIEEKIKI